MDHDDHKGSKHEDGMPEGGMHMHMDGAHGKEPALEGSAPGNGIEGPRPMAEQHMSHNQGDHSQMLQDFKKRFILSLALTIPVLALSPSVQDLLRIRLEFPGSEYLLFLISSVIYFYGGLPFLRGFFDDIHMRRPGMMTLISVAITVAYVYSSAVIFGLSGMVFFWELATLIDIMLLGHWIEMRSVLGASRALEELVRIMPSMAHLVEKGERRDVRTEDLRPGDEVLVLPGEKVPVDGSVIDGSSDVNESMLTGESRPVMKHPGDEVIGGSINGQGSMTAKVEKTGSETYLHQVIELVRQAQESKSRAQDLADRAAFLLTVIALSVGVVTLASWLYLGQGLAFAIERSVTVMVTTCPHALGLAIPLVVAVSTSIAARSGLLIRDRQAFEQTRDVQAAVFDKTGTLTEGRFGVTDIIPLAGMDEAALLMLAASLEARAEHPIARAVLESADARGVHPAVAERFELISGQGIQGSVEGRDLKIVGPGYLRARDISILDRRIEDLLGQGKTVVVVLEGDRPIGALALADVIREESREAIRLLKSMNIRCMMLTGDGQAVAGWVAGELGLDEFFAEVLPHEKAEAIKEIQKSYMVAMVGDGVNDAPALAQADVGIAIGAGTDVAIEVSDIILVRNDPREVAHVIKLSRNTYSKMLQNLLWATGYNVIAIPLAAGVLYGQGIVLSPAAGAALMSLSTVIVAINARMLKE
ncbi:MAG TPA: copper-translocating P-type ATPase [Methanotrichaceae archaeon]|nr:copper-translocating P-type ATPase [Methanotrichaceae archaeon]